ncbi:hypothetical protein LCGC14_2809100, partial [marine sediment metagenome]
LGINELADDSNIYYRGNLKRRKGYEQHMELATSPTGEAGTTWPSSGMQIIDHIRLKTDSGSDQHFIFVSMADTAGATNVITAFVATGMPTGSGTTYDIIGTATWSSAYALGQIIPWDTSDPFSAVVMDDKIWVALGDNNPYVLFYGTGSSWQFNEYPLCLYSNDNNTGRTDGKNIIPGSTETGNYATNGDWNGANFVGAGDGYIYVSDGRTLRWGVSEDKVRPDYGVTLSTETASGIVDRSSGVHTLNFSTDYPGTPGWAVNQFTGIEESLKLTDIETYKKYIFLYGNEGVVSFYQRGLYSNDFDKITETHDGVRGKMVATEKGLFYVGKDGIYGFDGETATELSKKIRIHLEGQNTSLPTDYDRCTLAYHDGFIWVSFPDSANKEVYIFDPDHIYDDERGDSHAPF